MCVEGVAALYLYLQKALPLRTVKTQQFVVTSVSLRVADLNLLGRATNMTAAPRAGVARAVPKTTLLAKHIQKLLTLNKDLGELDDAAIYVQGNVVQWVGATADLPKEYQAADEVLDLSDRVVMPGMVNSHHHMCAAVYC